jgi:hypothetical protein
VKFDNIYETDGFVNREFKNFQKSVIFVVGFLSFNDDLVNKISSYSSVSDVHWDENEHKLFISMDVEEKFERFFLDQACDLIEKLEEYGGTVCEFHVTVSKEVKDMNNMDGFIRDIYKGLEHWNFTRIMDCIEKVKV